MRTTIFLWNIVGKAADIFLITIIPLQGHFYRNPSFSIFRREVKDIIQVGFTLIDIFYKFRQTTFIIKYMFSIDTFIT